MMLHESWTPKKRRKSGLLFKTFILLTLSLIGFGAWQYGPEIYYRFSGDSLFRVSEHTKKLGESILTQKHKPQKTLAQIKENRNILVILEKNKPSDAEIQFLLAKLDFLELLTRMPLTDENLIKLCGRGFLPLQIKVVGNKNTKSSTKMALLTSKRIRKMRAINPASNHELPAKIMLLFTDFIYSGRIDRSLMLQLSQIETSKIPPYLQPVWQWVGLALLTINGQYKNQQKLLNQIKPITSTDPSQNKKHIKLALNNTSYQLIKCYGLFYGKQYHQALVLARNIKQNETHLLKYRIEAARMIAEIFLIQRGKASAYFFMKAAWELSEKKDAFIRQRLAELES